MRDRDNQRGERKPLVWEERTAFQEGRVIGQVQSAETARGSIYSVRFGRENFKDPSKLVPFLEPRDIAALRIVVDKVDDYLKTERTDDVKARFSSGDRVRREYV